MKPEDHEELRLNVIYNADCLGPEGLCTIPDGSIDMILCDLPYGVTANDWDVRLPMAELWAEYRRIIKKGGAIVLTATQPFATDLINAGRDLFKYDLIWEKSNVTGYLNAKSAPLRNHEQCLVFGAKVYNPQFSKGKAYTQKAGKRGPNYGERVQAVTVNNGFRYPKSVFTVSAEKTHPTAKPVALFEYLIKTYTNEGETVLDNCIGSGTTAIAAIRTGRQFIGWELDKGYHQTAIDRVKAEYEKTALFEDPAPKIEQLTMRHEL